MSRQVNVSLTEQQTQAVKMEFNQKAVTIWPLADMPPLIREILNGEKFDLDWDNEWGNDVRVHHVTYTPKGMEDFWALCTCDDSSPTFSGDNFWLVPAGSRNRSKAIGSILVSFAEFDEDGEVVMEGNYDGDDDY